MCSAWTSSPAEAAGMSRSPVDSSTVLEVLRNPRRRAVEDPESDYERAHHDAERDEQPLPAPDGRGRARRRSVDDRVTHLLEDRRQGVQHHQVLDRLVLDELDDVDDRGAV